MNPAFINQFYYTNNIAMQEKAKEQLCLWSRLYSGLTSPTQRTATESQPSSGRLILPPQHRQ